MSKEILGAPSVQMFCAINAAPGTSVATASSGTLDTRNAIGFGATGGIIGQSRHVSIALPTNTFTSTNKSVLFTLSHAASVTDAATNGTTLATITRAAGLGTDTLSRFEVDMIGIQPVLKVTALPSTGGTAESVVCAAVATLFRVEQTPILSSMLATGSVVIIAGGVTQAN